MPSTPWVVLFAVQWAALLFVVFALSGLARRVNSGGHAVTQPGPEAALNSLPSLGTRLQPAQLPREVLGSAAVVLFLSSTCGPCVQLGEALKAAGDGGSGGLPPVPIAVITDRADEALATAGITVVIDPKGIYKENLQVVATPTGIALDKDGKVVPLTFRTPWQTSRRWRKACSKFATVSGSWFFRPSLARVSTGSKAPRPAWIKL